MKETNKKITFCIVVRMWFTTNSYSGCILQVKWLNKQLGKLWLFDAEVRFLFFYSYYIFWLTIRCNWEKISSALWFLVNSIFFREKKSMYTGKCFSCLGKKIIKKSMYIEKNYRKVKFVVRRVMQIADKNFCKILLITKFSTNNRILLTFCHSLWKVIIIVF